MTAAPVSRSLAGTQSSHRWTELPGGFDTLNTRAIYPSSNEWGIPDLPPAEWTPARLVAYTDRREIARINADKGPARFVWGESDVSAVHFFLDDYRFETVWTKPERGLSRVAQLGAALTPDFSLWRDMPPVMQQWQTYRARWCGCWLAEHGIAVIPTVSWSTTSSYRYAFAGIPKHSVVAVSTVGVVDALARFLFADGYTEMIRQLAPSTVLVYGKTLPHDLLTGDLATLAPIRTYPSRWQQREG